MVSTAKFLSMEFCDGEICGYPRWLYHPKIHLKFVLDSHISYHLCVSSIPISDLNEVNSTVLPCLNRVNEL
jgi:hypothetical protein